MAFYQGPQFYSIDLRVCFCANTMLFIIMALESNLASGVVLSIATLFRITLALWCRLSSTMNFKVVVFLSVRDCIGAAVNL